MRLLELLEAAKNNLAATTVVRSAEARIRWSDTWKYALRMRTIWKSKTSSALIAVRILISQDNVIYSMENKHSMVLILSLLISNNSHYSQLQYYQITLCSSIILIIFVETGHRAAKVGAVAGCRAHFIIDGE